MRPTTRDFRAPAKLAWGLFVAALLLGIQPALAQDPVVTAAVPDMAEQETFDLVVTVSGNDFGADSQVDFFVTGTTDPGGITVKNVKRRNSKTLLVTLDIAATAQTAKKFDIQVRSGGRTGKGTELFKVLEKATGPDTTPPADVLDLALTEAGFNSATFGWSAPGDDGALGGPAAEYRLNVRTDGPVTLENWGTPLADWFAPVPGEPGAPQQGTAILLRPETAYWLALRAADESGNWSGISNQVAFSTTAFQQLGWSVETVDACPAGSWGGIGNQELTFDLDGRPAIFLIRHCDPPWVAPSVPRLARWNGGTWGMETLPVGVGDGDDLAFDPASGAPTIASSGWGSTDRTLQGKLRLHRKSGTSWESETVDSGVPLNSDVALAHRDDGQPVLAYPVKVKRTTAIRLAERSGSTWLKHELVVTNPMWLRLALDAEGNPLVVYREALDESFRSALWKGGAWTHEVVDAPGGGRLCGRVPTLAWDGTRNRFVAAHHCDANGEASWLRVCRRDAAPPAGWQCATAFVGAGEPALAFAPGGALYLAHVVNGYTPSLAESQDGGLTWSAPEAVDWHTDNRTCLAVDPFTGLPVISYYNGQQPEPALRFARRLAP